MCLSDDLALFVMFLRSDDDFEVLALWLLVAPEHMKRSSTVCVSSLTPSRHVVADCGYGPCVGAERERQVCGCACVSRGASGGS